MADRGVSARWLVPTALGLGLALAMLPLQTFLLDDWVQLQALEQGSWDLFRFASGEVAENRRAMAAGELPWFAHESLKISFFRPLSAALHGLDRVLFGHGTLGRGLHSALWYAALCAVATALYRRVLPEKHALLAAGLFAVAGAHCQPVLWFAARNALIAGTFGGLAVLAHLHGRWARWLLAPILLALSLAGSEAGLGAAAILLAHAWIMEEGRRRWTAMMPVAIVVVAWLAVYLATGSGVAHSGAYIDPLGEPVRFLVAAPGRMVFAVSVLLAGVSPELWYLWPRAHGWLTVWTGLAVAPFLLWLLAITAHASEARRRVLVWFGLAALLACVPVVAGLLGSRSFLVPSLATAPLVAALLLDPWRGEALKRVRIGLAIVLGLGHGLTAVGMWALAPWAAIQQASETSAALEQLVSLPGPVVLVDAPSADLATYGAHQLAVRGLQAPAWVALSVRPERVRVVRSERGYALLYPDWQWGDDSFKLLYRDITGFGSDWECALPVGRLRVLDDGAAGLRLGLETGVTPRFYGWRDGAWRELVVDGAPSPGGTLAPRGGEGGADVDGGPGAGSADPGLGR